MSDNFKREDLRIKKTYTALKNALLTLLKRKNFNQITVNDLCCEALTSRSTFYIHFNDKYDLLKYWLSELNNQLIKDVLNYEELEISVNQFIQKNKRIISNVLIDANTETLELANKFVAVIVETIIKEYDNNKNENASILSDFCTGGIVYMILMRVKNHFPQNDNMLTLFLFDMVKNIMEWVHDKGDY